MEPAREPAFNAPRAVVLAIAAFVLIHAGRSLLSEDGDIEVLLRFAFIPARYDAASPYAPDMRGGTGAEIWTFATYALLHGNVVHLIVNSVSLLAFGSALAWRFGPLRFALFSIATAAAGAATHLALHFGEPGPLVGASAAISGHMAAAMRFMFEAGGPLGALRGRGPEAFSVPAEPLGVSLKRPQVLIFLAVWFGANILFGVGGVAMGQGEASIAWEAHIGGFLAGLVLFSLLDPAPRTPPAASGPWADRWDEPLPPGADRRHDGETETAERR